MSLAETKEMEKLMTKIMAAVGSESGPKLRAVHAAFVSLGYETEVLGFKAESGINQQPGNLAEMEEGAGNRALWASKECPDAQFYIGIENGLVLQNGVWYDPACVIILTPEGQRSVAFGAFFPMPTWLAEEALLDKTTTDVGVIVQTLAGGEKDTMKYLSEGTVPREELLVQAIQCALVPIRFPNRYQK